MSNEKDASSGFRKKYLYLEKFTNHQEEDRVWKKQTMNIISKQATSIIIGSVLAMLALAIATAAFFR